MPKGVGDWYTRRRRNFMAMERKVEREHPTWRREDIEKEARERMLPLSWYKRKHAESRNRE